MSEQVSDKVDLPGPAGVLVHAGQTQLVQMLHSQWGDARSGVYGRVVGGCEVVLGETQPLFVSPVEVSVGTPVAGHVEPKQDKLEKVN